MPKLPGALRSEIETKGIDQKTAETLILRDALTGSSYVTTVLAQQSADAAKFTANFIANRDVAHVEGLVKEGKPTGELPSAKAFGEVFALRQSGELSSNNIDALLFALRHEKTNTKELAEKLGYLQENDSAALEEIIAKVLADPASQKAVADVKAGQDKAIGYLVGQVMKASQGKANPGLVSGLIRKQLGV
jgi:aspartyl-tRNA(Asn)/glutamyl-tRNA(Gln) amidotransferase subunit B